MTKIPSSIAILKETKQTLLEMFTYLCFGWKLVKENPNYLKNIQEKIRTLHTIAKAQAAQKEFLFPPEFLSLLNFHCSRFMELTPQTDEKYLFAVYGSFVNALWELNNKLEARINRLYEEV